MYWFSWLMIKMSEKYLRNITLKMDFKILKKINKELDSKQVNGE